MPSVFLEDTTFYALWASDSSEHVLTFKGRIDNGGLSPIAADGYDKVARGFFF